MVERTFQGGRKRKKRPLLPGAGRKPAPCRGWGQAGLRGLANNNPGCKPDPPSASSPSYPCCAGLEAGFLHLRSPIPRLQIPKETHQPGRSGQARSLPTSPGAKTVSTEQNSNSGCLVLRCEWPRTCSGVCKVNSFHSSKILSSLTHSLTVARSIS